MPAQLRPAVVEAITELTGCAVAAISDEADLVNDLGVDSMAGVSLLVAIEDRYGVVLPDGCEGSLVGIRTVGQLVERLALVYGVTADEPSPPTPAASPRTGR